MGREGGDDEAAEGAVELVGRVSIRGSGRRSGCAKELGVGAGEVLVGGTAVLDVTVLPISEAFGVGHLELALADGLGEGADGALAALGKRSGVGVHDSIGVRATVASAHDDAFAGREPATEVIKRKRGLNSCHNSVNLIWGSAKIGGYIL